LAHIIKYFLEIFLYLRPHFSVVDTKIIIPLLALSILGLFLIGSGMTGMVISESCCLGTGCSPENLCDVAKPHLEFPSTTSSRDTYLGVGMLILSVSLFIVLNRSP
jgi:hypothetical protein